MERRWLSHSYTSKNRSVSLQSKPSSRSLLSSHQSIRRTRTKWTQPGLRLIFSCTRRMPNCKKSISSTREMPSRRRNSRWSKWWPRWKTSTVMSAISPPFRCDQHKTVLYLEEVQSGPSPNNIIRKSPASRFQSWSQSTSSGTRSSTTTTERTRRREGLVQQLRQSRQPELRICWTQAPSAPQNTRWTIRTCSLSMDHTFKEVQALASTREVLRRELIMLQDPRMTSSIFFCEIIG